MKTVPFFPWADPSACLGYGTTRLTAAASTRERLRLLETAFELGFTHFDTAPYYGYGEAERLVGTFAKGRRDKITITSKFGIEPQGVAKVRWLNLLARRVVRTVPWLRSAISKKVNSLVTTGNFFADKAEASLDRTLRALKSDYVDLLLMHEPTIVDAASLEMLGFLNRQVERGCIRAYGCGGNWQSIQEIAQSNLQTGKWLQFEDSVLTRRIEAIESSGLKAITFASLNDTLGRLTAYLNSDTQRAKQWSKEVGVNFEEPANLANLLLASCCNRNKDGIVLLSSSRVERIHLAAQINSDGVFSQSQFIQFERLTAPLIRAHE